MSERKNIPEITQKLLWGIAAGRCEFEGCNKILYKHDVTDTTGNYAENAHIYAVSPGGSRYNAEEIDVNNFKNLMLVCQACHKTIDDDENTYTAERLFDMKQKHEERVTSFTEADFNRKSTMLFYTADISGTRSVIAESKARVAVVRSGRYPTSISPIDIGLTELLIKDDKTEFYEIHKCNLRTAFEKRVLKIIEIGEHISVFSLAPQPLLMYLGYLLLDKYGVSIFQRQRRNDTDWHWEDRSYTPIEFIIKKSDTNGSKVAVVFSLSGTIDVSEIYSVLGDDTTVYTLTIPNPNKYFVENPAVLDVFALESRKLLDLIRQECGEQDMLHIFPAMPVSLAVRFGMDYMPNIDRQMLIYNKIINKGFIPTITIGDTDE